MLPHKRKHKHTYTPARKVCPLPRPRRDESTFDIENIHRDRYHVSYPRHAYGSITTMLMGRSFLRDTTVSHVNESHSHTLTTKHFSCSLSRRSTNVAFPLTHPRFSTVLCTSGTRSAAGAWWPHAKFATIARWFDFGGYFATPVARGKLATSTTPRTIVFTSLAFYTIFASGLRVPACVARDITLLVPLLRAQGIVALKTLRKVYFFISFQLC